jgi:small subunit ribosomal protein S21
MLEVCERIAFMIKVKSRGNETAEQMLRRFKKMCEKEGLTKDIKRIAYYEKPSEKRRRRARSKPRVFKPMGNGSSSNSSGGGGGGNSSR